MKITLTKGALCAALLSNTIIVATSSAQTVSGQAPVGSRQSPIEFTIKGPKAEKVWPVDSWVKLSNTVSSNTTVEISNSYDPSSPIEKEWGSVVITPTSPNAGTFTYEPFGTYTLTQFHFHTPAEHKINGIVAPLEIHFVYTTTKPEQNLCTHTYNGGPDPVGVVAVLVDEGAENAELNKLLKAGALPQTKADPKLTISGFNIQKILPPMDKGVIYIGSLTTPKQWPSCDEPEGTAAHQQETKVFPENVRFYLPSQHITASSAQIAKLKAIFPEGNAREPQPHSGRALYAFPGGY